MSSPDARSAFATRWLVATALLVATELALTLGLGFRELLTGTERLQASAAIVSLGAATAALALAAGAWLGGRLDRLARAGDARRTHAAVAVLVGLVSAPFFWSLTSGRRVRETGLRPLVAFVFVLGFAAACTALFARVRRGPSWRLVAVFVLGLVAVELADSMVLTRLYPAFHGLLALVAVVLAACAGASVPASRALARLSVHRGGAARIGLAAGLVVVVAGPVAYVVARAPNASFVVERHASTAGKWLHLVGTLVSDDADAPLAPGATARTGVSPTDAAGIDLHDRDILLISIDALRADRLAAYGGHGLTPSMDRLAEEGAVFERAYTTTPHTSYALASLLTGKFLRPVLELPNAPREHTTLPERLRRYGYRTAAFYPPAIFFVDADRFRALEEAGFGFEYRKQMFAPADERVAQVESYLDEAEPGRPLFVWVHFFEPHEPYDPPAEFRSEGATDEALYDGEVRAVDRAVGRLVAAFRARRPGATVILTADHGEEFGDHGGRYHGSTLYDEQVHVPLVWSSPGVVAPHRITAPVEHVDVATTLLAALAVPRDARMRGDDLGALLASTRAETAGGPPYAFADIADQRMVVDGRWKAICNAGSSRCELFDLIADPGERRNAAGEHADELTRLRAAVAEFTASIPRIEAMSMGDSAGWPAALARAELGDVTVAPELEPLLASPRAEVRGAAARLLGALRFGAALRVIEALAANDPDEGVQDEAALASITLGSDTHLERVRAIARRPAVSVEADERPLRAASILAVRGDAAGSARLGRCVADETLDEVRRRGCVSALGRIGARDQLDVLVAALDDVRLRPDVAAALGEIGDARAADALAASLALERYVPPRVVSARALMRLGDRRMEPLVRRYLGMTSGIPGGLALLLEAGRLGRPSANGGDLREATIPGFACTALGCAPEAGALLPIRATRPRRLVVRVHASQGARIVFEAGGTSQPFGPLPPGDCELSLAIDATNGVRVSSSGDARIVAYAVVAPVDEIPPPAAEPWDAGVADSGANTPSP